MHIIPHLTDHRTSTVGTILAHALLRSIVPRARTAHIWRSTRLLGQLALNTPQRVHGTITRRDIRLHQPTPRAEPLVVFDRCLEEFNHFLVLDVVGSVARDIKCRIAGGVFAELVAPEIRVWRALVNPVGVHPVEQVVSAEGFDECADIGPRVGWNKCTVGKAVCRVW